MTIFFYPSVAIDLVFCLGEMKPVVLSHQCRLDEREGEGGTCKRGKEELEPKRTHQLKFIDNLEHIYSRTLSKIHLSKLFCVNTEIKYNVVVQKKNTSAKFY